MEQHQIYAVLGFLVLLWCFHQSNALQEGEQYEQLTRQGVVEHFHSANETTETVPKEKAGPDEKEGL